MEYAHPRYSPTCHMRATHSFSSAASQNAVGPQAQRATNRVLIIPYSKAESCLICSQPDKLSAMNRARVAFPALFCEAKRSIARTRVEPFVHMKKLSAIRL